MKISSGQVAAITGGGSGIGRELALACAARGMAVAIGDVEPEAAQRTVELLAEQGARAFAQRVDVTDPAQVEAFAQRTFAEFGACHLLCNNAGVLVLGPLLEAARADWQWVMDVNLFGIVNGIAAFVPRMLAMNTPAHVLNSVSLRGIAAGPSCGVYAASKFAALGLTETLRLELVDRNIGVTALCPWSVDTGIMTSERNRPGHATGGLSERDIETLKTAGKNPITIAAAKVAVVALEAVEDNELYAITHPCARELLERRFTEMMESLERVRSRHPELP
jgi:NAD(P)-dependent dehydrogenase (short-subunit alcohol dehydrogenase family)